jgi:excisionase family DNA binding protein
MTSAAAAREPIAAAASERDDLMRIATVLRSLGGQAKLVGPGGEEIALPPSLYDILERAVGDLTAGEAVAIVPVHAEMTTNQAADLLNVSRQYLVRLLDRGEIPFTRTGTHRRVKFGDLMSYKQQRDSRRREGLAELTRVSEDLGLYDIPLGGVDCRRLEPS